MTVTDNRPIIEKSGPVAVSDARELSVALGTLDAEAREGWRVLNLLQRTRRLLQGITPPPRPRSQFYHVACPEGHPLSGERTEGYQALRCPTCGEGIFVLPRSPLPEPPEPAESASQPTAARRKASVSEIEPIALTDPFPDQGFEENLGPEVEVDDEWLDLPAKKPAAAPQRSSNRRASDSVDTDAATAPEPAGGAGSAPAKPRKKPAPAARPDQAERGSGSRDQSTDSRPEKRREVPAFEPTTRESLGDWLRRRRNPLLFLMVGLLVAGTVAFRLRRSRLEDLPRVIELGRTQGLTALDEGNFDTAHRLLSAAKRALETLGDSSAENDSVREGALEAAIFASLSPDSLETILSDASADPAEWNPRFDSAYKGRGVIVDAHITAVPDPAGASGRYEVDYTILPVGESAKPSRIGRLDLAGFTLFDHPKRQVGDRVVFGARLASFRCEREAGDEIWRVGLDPESGVYILHPSAMEAIGKPSGSDPQEENRP